MKEFIALMLLWAAFPHIIAAQQPSHCTLQRALATGVAAPDCHFCCSHLQPDGKLVVAGYKEEKGVKHIYLQRFLPTGQVDLHFGVQGKVLLDLTKEQEVATQITQQSDGKLIIVGQVGNYPNAKVVVLRINDKGALDRGFGWNGYSLIHPSKSISTPQAVAIGADDEIVVAGLAKAGAYHSSFLARLDHQGALDEEFGKEGIILKSISHYNDQVNDVLIQSTGHILLLTTKSLMRFAPSGQLDKAFTQLDPGAALLALDDKHFVVVSTAFKGQQLNYALRFYRQDGQAAIHYANRGQFIYTFGKNINAKATHIIQQPDGYLIIGGYVEEMNEPHSARIALLRLNAAGQLDSSFGENGALFKQADGQEELLKGLHYHQSGQLFLLGEAWNPNNQSFLAVLQTNAESASLK